MQLSLYTDYSLRVLVFLGIHCGRLSSINEIATCYNISQNHLMKVVHNLGKAGFITTVRGRKGGLQLAKPSSEILLGSIIRHTEDANQPIKCGNCIIQESCIIQDIIKKAFVAFYAVLDEYSLSDILKDDTKLKHLLKNIKLEACKLTS